MHNTRTIPSGMVPGVKKVGVVHSIAPYAEKCESEGAFYMILMRSWSRAGEALSAQQ